MKRTNKRNFKYQSQQETQEKAESAISSVEELDNSEYAKKGLSKHNPADNIHTQTRQAEIEKEIENG